MGWLQGLLGGLEGGSEVGDCRVFVHDVLVPFTIGFEVREQIDELDNDLVLIDCGWAFHP